MANKRRKKLARAGFFRIFALAQGPVALAEGSPPKHVPGAWPRCSPVGMGHRRAYNQSMVYLDDDIAGFDLEGALPLLSAQRREQVLSFRHELGRKTSAMAYVLLCRALREEFGLRELPQFGYGEHGKPYIVGHEDIHFNLSHCREAVVCAVGVRPVGIDVESIREYHDSLVRYTMNAAEVRQIEESAERGVEFIRLWTQKEAVVKLSGRGITDGIKDVLTLNTLPIETHVVRERGYIYSVVSA